MGFGPIDMLFFAGMLAVMWFLIVQPRRREQQALQKMYATLKKGDRVLTNSGMYGEIVNIKDQIITLRFHNETRIDFDRSAISKALTGEGAQAASKDKKDSKQAELQDTKA